MGYLLLTQGVRREAFSRVESAIQMGWLVVDEEFERMDPVRTTPTMHEAMGVRRFWVSAKEALELRPLRGLFESVNWQGRSQGFALLDEEQFGRLPAREQEQEDHLAAIRDKRGPRALCMVFVVQDRNGEGFSIAVRPLRGALGVADRIRDLAFGKGPEVRRTATVTIFEGPVRIATNVRRRGAGTRALATDVSDAVAQRVLVKGLPWKARAWVVDRWVLSRYDPIRSVDDEVIGMLYAGLDEEPYVVAGNRTILIFLASILGLALLASAAAWLLGGTLARPLADLTTAVQALERGDRERIHVAPSATQEIVVLGDAFNKMARVVTEKTTALENSRRQAQQALDDYMEVLAFVAHELKSPISGALVQMNLIESGYAGEVAEALSRPLSAIRNYLDHGLEIALSFNDLSRAETRGFAARKQRIADVREELVRPAVEQIAEQAARGKMSVVLDGDTASLDADPGLLRTVLDNLLGNAVKYGKEETEVRVTLRRDQGRIRAAVRNEGVGVAKERYSELFEKFSRIQDSRLRTRKGTGVGLYLARRIVDLHGGAIGVEGEEGEWIQFWFELPCDDPS
jgi:signal transduction histidine kinase